MPVKSDLLLDAPDVVDTQAPAATIDSRVRIGYPRQDAGINATRSDLAFAQGAIATIPRELRPTYGQDGTPAVPDRSQPYLDARRALVFVPASGVASITGGRVATYAKGNVETLVADGTIKFTAIDQSYAPDPAAPDQIGPGLSYLRLGKPEPKLTNAEGQPLARSDDRLMDQKYNSGIGLFSDGGLSAWTRKPLSFRSNESFLITAPGYSLSSYGESRIVSYELSRKDDIEKVNTGAFADAAVDRKIMNVNWLRPTPIGWYRQIFDRSRALSFTTANKGDFSLAAAYSLSVGAKFEHSLAVGLGTSYAGTVAINKGFSIEIGSTGATFKHPFGSWTQEIDAGIEAYKSIKLAVSGIDTAPFRSVMTGYSVALHAAVAAQSAAFLAYNAALLAMADQKLTAEHASLANPDDAHGLLKALEDGVKVYEAAISLSAITCAAGIVMGAVQAGWVAARTPDPLMPSIELTPLGIRLACGPASITLGPTGIDIIAAPGSVRIGGLQIQMMAPDIQNSPVPPPPPLPT